MAEHWFPGKPAQFDDYELERTEQQVAEGPLVYPSEIEDEVALLNAKGEPIRWRTRHPIGFSRPTRPSPRPSAKYRNRERA